MGEGGATMAWSHAADAIASEIGVNGTAGVRGPAVAPPPPPTPSIAAAADPVPPGARADPGAYGVPNLAGDRPVRSDRAALVSRHGVPGTPPGWVPPWTPSRFFPGPGVAATPPLPPTDAGFLMSPSTLSESASVAASVGRYRRSSKRRWPSGAHALAYAASAAACAAASPRFVASPFESSGSRAGNRAGPALARPSPGDSAGCSGDDDGDGGDGSSLALAPPPPLAEERRVGAPRVDSPPPPPSSDATSPCTMTL